jgi:hypothetical protein
MLRKHPMRDIDKDLQSAAVIRLAALRRAARAQERQRPSTDVAGADHAERLPADSVHSGWEFLLQVPA